MAEARLDVLVGISIPTVRYLSGYYSSLDARVFEYMLVPGGSNDRAFHALAIVPVDEEPVLVLDAGLAVTAAATSVEEIEVYGGEPLPPAGKPLPDSREERVRKLLSSSPREATPFRALAKALERRGLARARIGIERDGLSPQAEAALTGELPGAKLVDCTQLLRLVRCVKTAAEITVLRQALAIDDEALVESLKEARAGTSVARIARSFRLRVAEQGADVHHFGLGIGGLGLAMASSHVLRAGDVLSADVGCIYEGGIADTAATFAIGELSSEMLRKYVAARDSIQAGAAMLGPGCSGSIVYEAMVDALGDELDPGNPPHGHGIGFQSREYPLLVARGSERIADDCVSVAADLPLESNMVVNLETALGTPGLGTVAVEQTFLVTEEGCSPLVQQERSEPLCV